MYQIAVEMSTSTSHLPQLYILLHAPLPARLLACSTIRGYILDTNWGRAVLFSIGGCHGNEEYGDNDNDDSMYHQFRPMMTNADQFWRSEIQNPKGATLDMDFSPYRDFTFVCHSIKSHWAWRIFKQVNMNYTLVDDIANTFWIAICWVMHDKS